ncbi:hypothetical protein MXB_595, partial [Myxobolus squamalis]
LKIIQLSENLKKNLKRDDFILFYQNLKLYLQDQDILSFLTKIQPFFTLELFRQVEKVISGDHKAVYEAYVQLNCSPKPLKTLQKPLEVQSIQCTKCLKNAPYQLPCGHFTCSRCYAEATNHGRKCLTCKNSYLIEDVIETFCGDS